MGRQTVITCKMYVLHTDRHLRRSINLDAPVVEFGDAALPLAQPEADGRERSEYSPVIGRGARGSRKFRRHVPSSQVGWEDGDLSVVSVGAEVRQRTAVSIACMLLVFFCKCSLNGVATSVRVVLCSSSSVVRQHQPGRILTFSWSLVDCNSPTTQVGRLETLMLIVLNCFDTLFFFFK